jgi:hypothetical protein
MAGKVDKLIVTNFDALDAKYAAGTLRVRAALTQLIQSDFQRGLVTEVIGLDDGTAMQAINGSPVTIAGDCAQNKQAIDELYRAYTPDYLVILGSIDVIPHQDMKNPLYVDPQGEDPDEFAYGDLPYACDAPYSQQISDFKGPTRVVSRLPDRTGANDPQGLVDLIDEIIRHQPRPRSDYSDYHAVSAQIWEASSRQSVGNMFGSNGDLQLVPPQGRPWPAKRLGRRVHFYNCHGSANDPRFFGQPASGAHQYPEALHSADLAGNIQPGTVVTAECCYGGQLYATTALLRDAPTCNRYLEASAIGIWASTTIAYGPATGNGAADLITQYFITNVLRGASLGRAALQARQSFVRAASPAGPGDLKTLAQFNLYGDASVTPVATMTKSMAPFGVAASIAVRADRTDRRLLLARQGGLLAASEPDLVRTDDLVSDEIVAQLRAHAHATEEEITSVLSFRLHFPDSPLELHMLKAMQTATDGYVVAFVNVQRPDDIPVRRIKLVVGRVQTGRVIQISTVESR